MAIKSKDVKNVFKRGKGHHRKRKSILSVIDQLTTNDDETRRNKKLHSSDRAARKSHNTHQLKARIDSISEVLREKDVEYYMESDCRRKGEAGSAPTGRVRPLLEE